MENSSTEQLAEITLKKLSNRAAPSAEAVFLRRVSYGIAPDGFYPDGGKGDIAKFRAGGSSLSTRTKAWVNSQLNVPANKRLTDIGPIISPLTGSTNAYRTLGLTLRQEWDRYYRRKPPYEKVNSRRPMYEREALTLVRNVYSRYQLFERLAYFWHNHFNVYIDGNRASYALWGTWNDTIREGVLGNFYELLVNTAEHPAMLVYLDNYINTRQDPNENYAREVFELHTLGAMNYYGVKSQDKVPKYTSKDGVPPEWIGHPKGYVDDDVYEAARILTGWTFDHYKKDSNENYIDTGQFYFNEDKADDDQKYILGHRYLARGRDDHGDYTHARFGSTSDSALQKQGKHLLWKLATHPGTAKYIAWKLVRHFLDDNADKHSDVINAVAKTFLSNVDKPDQLKRCYLTLFNHPKMYSRTYWGNKKAPPTEMIMQACRTMGCKRIFRDYKPSETYESSLGYQASQSKNICIRLNTIGNRQWFWTPPDGFPEEAKYWLSANSLIMTSRYINLLHVYEGYLDNASTSDDDEAILTVYAETLKAFPDVSKQTPEALVKYWATRIWGFTPSATEMKPILDFFCRPIDAESQNSPTWPPNFAISDPYGNKGVKSNSTPHRWRYKLRNMTALLMNHPYAMLR